jgi:hypothetical protein
MMDACGHDAIEVNEWGSFRAKLGKLLRRAGWRTGIVNHLSASFAFGLKASGSHRRIAGLQATCEPRSFIGCDRARLCSWGSKQKKPQPKTGLKANESCQPHEG